MIISFLRPISGSNYNFNALLQKIPEKMLAMVGQERKFEYLQ